MELIEHSDYNVCYDNLRLFNECEKDITINEGYFNRTN